MTKIDLPPKKTLKDNIFAKYFLLFSTIMLVVLTFWVQRLLYWSVRIHKGKLPICLWKMLSQLQTV